MEVNQKELAVILGVSDRRIRQLKQEFGLFADGKSEGKGRKRYVLEKCVPEYINYKLETEVQGGTSKSKEKEQAEHEQIKKEISKLKLKKLKRELHAAEDVEEFLTDMLIKFRNRLLSVPQKTAPLIIGEDDVNIVLDTLEKEMFACLDELSEYDPATIDKETIIEALEDEEE